MIFLTGFITADFIISHLLLFLGNSAGITRAFESSVWLLSLLTAAVMGHVVFGIGFYQGYAGCKLFWTMQKLMLISYARTSIPKILWFISKGRAIRLAWKHFLSQVTRSVLQIGTIKEYDCQIVACNKSCIICRFCLRPLRECVGKAFARCKLWIICHSLTLKSLRLLHEHQTYLKLKTMYTPAT